jgi:hypothetical protein
MKKIPLGFALILVCLTASCDLFFSDNTGAEGSVTLSLGDGSAYTGVFNGAASFTGIPGGEGGGFPDLGDSRIVVYNSAGKALGNRFLQGSRRFRQFGDSHLGCLSGFIRDLNFSCYNY